MTTSLRHLLITVTFHAYMICEEREEKRLLAHAAGSLMEEAAKIGEDIRLPIAPSTILDDTGIDQVRELIEQDPDVKDMLSKVEDYHFSAWIMPARSMI